MTNSKERIANDGTATWHLGRANVPSAGLVFAIPYSLFAISSLRLCASVVRFFPEIVC